nr:transcriptional regulator EFH1 isoform X2 [Tanacetum cinerariifolium]
MMERGFYVSPQQCEDKFNDLNKRYKRVNDILGRGIACKVVENQTLLESMDHIPKKLKEEAKKLLNSKHLFFREMCAYHNSCGVGTSGASGVAHHSSPPEVTTTTNEHQRQICVHSNDDDDVDDDNDEGDDDGDEDEDDCEQFEEEDDGLSSRKRGRTMENDVLHQFDGEVSVVMQDMTKSAWEKRQWMKGRMMQLEEQRVGYQGQSYELEKQRLKWLKFCYKKEREMEVEKLRNERVKLENERMVLLLKQKEMELVDLQHQYSSNVHKRTSDPSSING